MTKDIFCELAGMDCAQLKLIKEELEHYKKTGIPRCHICKKPFKNGVDSITKKVSKYLWVSDCEHCKDVGIMIG